MAAAEIGTDDVAQLTDAELAGRIAGPEAALRVAAEAEVCRRYAPRIRGYGQKHLRDPEGARDLVQAVLVAVLEALRAGRVERSEQLDRYVLGTCRHIADRIRRADGRAAPTDPAQLALDPDLLSPEPAGVEFAGLVRCMGELDTRARTVLHLSFGRERKADEIAAVLEMTAVNVRVVRHRALAQLRRCLEPKGTR